MTGEFNAVLQLVAGALKSTTLSKCVEYAEVILCTAHDAKLVTDSEANSIATQFSLNLHWSEESDND